MTGAVMKKRKLAHNTSSAQDDDLASFASFGDSEEETISTGNDNLRLDLDGGDDSGDESKSGRHEISSVTLPTKPTTKGTKSTSNAPTRDQRNQAAAHAAGAAYSAGTFKSNKFKLQVDELLTHVRPRRRGKLVDEAEAALHTLRKTIEGIPVREPQPIAQAEQELRKKDHVVVPFPDPAPPRYANYKVQFAKATHVNVVGSHVLQTSARKAREVEIDMTIMMPRAMFQEKDYLNHRYFYKRSYYLACVAAAVKRAHGKEYALRFASWKGDALKPVIVVEAKSGERKDQGNGAGQGWRINIIPCVGPDTFATEKLAPSKNCVRPVEGLEAKPTPFYNSSLRADMVTAPYLKLLHSTSKSCAAFKDACVLGGTWLRQRGIGGDIAAGGFGNFEWSALLACMLQGGGPQDRPLLSEGYSSYQLFKATLQLLAGRDLSKRALVTGSEESIATAGDGHPIVWDGARSHNLLYKMSTWSYASLQQEAKSTLTMLSEEFFDGFDATFILKAVNPVLRYDCGAQISASFLESSGSEDSTDQHRLEKLYDTIKQGLTDRVKFISLEATPLPSWDFGAARPSSRSATTIAIRFIVNPEQVNRTVDHGPSAEDTAAAAAYRNFWGDKAELRRFKDGSILESLIWSAAPGEPPVLEQVLRIMLEKHFGSAAVQSLSFQGDVFAKLLPFGSTRILYEPFVEAYKQLESDIRGLEDLPLSVRQIMPADTSLRYSSLVVPLKGRQGRQQPADVVIQFEGSARWPDDLVAIQRTKIAFLMKLSELLQEGHRNITARIGLENEEQNILNQAFLDISYDSGAAFRLRIHHDREQTLLERILKGQSAGPQMKEAAATGLATYKRQYLKSPTHTQAVARLCSRHPALSGTMRLVKQWFASHLLTSHIADEVIELIAIRTFTQPWPWAVPSSVQVGFLRTLHWLSRWDWRADPLIVDLSGSGDLQKAECHSITTNFEAWRKIDPAFNRLTLFAASNVDLEGSTWTDGRPAKVVAGRMTALAKAACAEIESKEYTLDASSLFNSPLDDYDFVIYLDPSNASGLKARRTSSSAPAYKNLEVDMISADDDSLIGYDPARDLLHDLETAYGSAVVFFSGSSNQQDKQNKHVIAGLWSPATAPRAWKLNLAYATVPVVAKEGKEGGDVVVKAEIDKDAMLAEMARVGGDLVVRVQRNR